MADIDYDPAALQAILRDPQMGQVLKELAEPDVEFAQQLAPKRTGAGARSIHVESVLDGDMWEARAAWDQEHYYMGFHELGTRKMPPHPFMRPAFR